MKKSTFSGCTRSGVVVTPANWKTAKASIKRPWRISYRYYDPAFKAIQGLWGKQFSVTGMNDAHDLASRQEATQTVLDYLLDRMDRLGFNPITGKFMAPQRRPDTDKLTEETPLIRALELGLTHVEADPKTIGDIASVVGFFARSAEKIGLDQSPVGTVKVIHVVDILNGCGQLTKTVKGKEEAKVWNDNQYNYFRKYLGIIFSALKRLEIIDANPMANIPKKEFIEEPDHVRRVLTPDERKVILPILQKKKAFWRFVNIFKPSGTRIAELCRVQGKHIDLDNQRYRVLIKKRRKKRWVWKTIPDLTLPLWREAVAGCGMEQYVFSKWLKPGDKKIDPRLITKRWKRLVKDKLGIDADLYSLKHLYDTEIIDEVMAEEKARQLALKTVAAINDHTSGKMVDEVYDVGKEARRHEAAKKRGRGF